MGCGKNVVVVSSGNLREWKRHDEVQELMVVGPHRAITTLLWHYTRLECIP